VGLSLTLPPLFATRKTTHGGDCFTLMWNSLDGKPGRRSRLTAVLVVVCLGSLSSLLLAPCGALASGHCSASEPCCFADLHSTQEKPPEDGTAGWDEPTAAAQLVSRYTTPSWMRSCISSMHVGHDKAAMTADILKSALRNAFPHTELLTDSRSSGLADNAGRGPRLPMPHSVKLNLPAAIDRVLEGSQLQAPHVHREGGGGQTVHSAWDFHYGLADALRLTYDPRTYYITPFTSWSLYRVASLWPALDARGAQIYVLDASPEWARGGCCGTAFTIEDYRAVHGEPPPELSLYEGLQVTHVNGDPAEVYMQRRADSLGQLRSPGARLNHLLQQEAAEPLFAQPPPNTDEETFTFADGSSATWKLTVVHSGDAKGVKELRDTYNYNPNHKMMRSLLEGLAHQHEAVLGPVCPAAACEGGAETPQPGNNATISLLKLKKWAETLQDVDLLGGFGMDEREDAPGSCGFGDGSCPGFHGGVAAGGDNQPGGAYPPASEHQPHLPEAAVDAEGFYNTYDDDGYDDDYPYDEEDFRDLRPTNLGHGLTQVVAYWDASGESVLGVFHHTHSTVVLKLSTFHPIDGPWVEPAAFLRALHGAVSAAEAYARPKGIDRLLVDVSGNDLGGSTVPAFFLLRLIQRSWKTADALCDGARLSVSPLGEFFTKAEEEGDLGAELVRHLRETAPEDAIEAAQAVIQIVEAVRRQLLRLSKVSDSDSAFDLVDLDIVAESSKQLQERLASTGGSPPSESLSQLLELTEAYVAEAARRLLIAAVGRSEGSVDGALKYDAASRQELKGLAWYRQRRQPLLWGGQPVNQTQLFLQNSCQDALQSFAEIHGNADGEVHGFKKVVLLSDGVCTGACSIFATRLSLSDSVRSVTFGGSRRAGPPALSGATGSNSNDWLLFSHGSSLAYVVSLMLGRGAPCHHHRPKASGTLEEQQQQQHRSCSLDISDAQLPVPTSAYISFGLASHYEPYLGASALPREFYNLQADAHLWLWVRSPGVLPRPVGNDEPSTWDIARAWKAAYREFDRCPLLSSWKGPPRVSLGDHEGDVLVLQSVPLIGTHSSPFWIHRHALLAALATAKEGRRGYLNPLQFCSFLRECVCEREKQVRGRGRGGSSVVFFSLCHLCRCE